MDQMVRNDIAFNCIPIVRIAFLVRTHLIAFLRILITYLRKYAAYLECSICYRYTKEPSPGTQLAQNFREK